MQSQRQMNHEFGDWSQLGHANAIDEEPFAVPFTKGNHRSRIISPDNCVLADAQQPVFKISGETRGPYQGSSDDQAPSPTP